MDGGSRHAPALRRLGQHGQLRRRHEQRPHNRRLWSPLRRDQRQHQLQQPRAVERERQAGELHRGQHAERGRSCSSRARVPGSCSRSAARSAALVAFLNIQGTSTAISVDVADNNALAGNDIFMSSGSAQGPQHAGLGAHRYDPAAAAACWRRAARRDAALGASEPRRELTPRVPPRRRIRWYRSPAGRSASARSRSGPCSAHPRARSQATSPSSSMPAPASR